MDHNEREKIIKKINALLNMTLENGASEAEAIKAAEKANELMLEYGLQNEDIGDIEEARYGKRRRTFAEGSYRRRSYHPVSNCVTAVAKFCDCKVWYDNFDMVFFGTDIDTAFAWYLIDMIKNAMNTEYRSVEEDLKLEAKRQGQKIHGKTLRASFMLGMAMRINQRLREMKEERDQKITDHTTGTDLVVVKNAVVEQKFEQLNMSLKKTYRAANNNVHGSAYGKGREAGDKVQFNRPVGGSGSTRQIEG